MSNYYIDLANYYFVLVSVETFDAWGSQGFSLNIKPTPHHPTENFRFAPFLILKDGQFSNEKNDLLLPNEDDFLI